MIADPIQWDDATPDPEDEYQALLRSLRWAEGFGLLFVRCSPAEGQALITRVTTDAPQKCVTNLTLDSTDWNFYEQVKQLPDRDNLDIVFVTGLETLLDEYLRPGYGSQGDYYSQDNVPRILSHLNLRRETLRDEFKICFVFLLPLYALKYIIRRAPDFFDWRSGVFEFIPNIETVERESSRLLSEGDFDEYLKMSPQERRQRFLDIQTWLEENPQDSERRASLLFKQGNLFYADQDYQSAIASYDQALKIKPGQHEAWYNRGISLNELERYEEAIKSYNQALELKPGQQEAWYNRGISLQALECYEEAIKSYDQALKLKPDHHKAWYNRGISLQALERYKEAIKSYDQALKFKPDYYQTWGNRGNSLQALERYKEAIKSYDQTLKFKPDTYQAWNNRSSSLIGLKRYEDALEGCDRALRLKPDFANPYYIKARCFALMGQGDVAIDLLKQAIELDSAIRSWAQTNSDFDTLRDDARFQVLVGNTVQVEKANVFNKGLRLLKAIWKRLYL